MLNKHAMVSALVALTAVLVGGPVKAVSLFDANTGKTATYDYTFVANDANAFTNIASVVAGGSATWQSTSTVTSSQWPVAQSIWTPDSADSSWITAEGTTKTTENNSVHSWSNTAGYYVFKTTFNTTGYDQLALGGSWLTDNNGVGIYLNGKAVTTVPTTPGPVDYGQPLGTYNFFNTASTDFVYGGDNSLYFVVQNTPVASGIKGNPVGLRVEAGVTGEPVPEPAFLQLGVLLSSGALMAFRGRRKNAA